MVSLEKHVTCDTFDVILGSGFELIGRLTTSVKELDFKLVYLI